MSRDTWKGRVPARVSHVRCGPWKFFFFSSRRRHPRCSRDWSSDVCSSDLFAPSKILPKPQQDTPVIYGVEPSYLEIGHLRVTEGRFFDASDNAAAGPVCVLGAAAKDSLFGASPAVGEYIKLNDQWCHVIGIVAPQMSAQSEVSGVRTEIGRAHV